mgnify:CR=1 FL=1
MKFFNILFIIFITSTSTIKANSNENLINLLKEGNKIVFIRHAYAPGGGDPENFTINDCKTQRNLNDQGKKQAQKIGNFFTNNKIPIEIVLSSEWCRCKETASIAFKNFQTKNFLNSFYSKKFADNKYSQMINLMDYVKKFKGKKNLIFVTHYVVINEVLSYAPSSGEIVISDKEFKKIGSIKIDY